MPSATLSATERCLVGGADDRHAVRRAGRPPPTLPIHRRPPRPPPHISGTGPALAAPAALATVAAAVALLVGGRRRHGERGFRGEKRVIFMVKAGQNPRRTLSLAFLREHKRVVFLAFLRES